MDYRVGWKSPGRFQVKSQDLVVLWAVLTVFDHLAQGVDTPLLDSLGQPSRLAAEIIVTVRVAEVAVWTEHLIDLLPELLNEALVEGGELLGLAEGLLVGRSLLTLPLGVGGQIDEVPLQTF